MYYAVAHLSENNKLFPQSVFSTTPLFLQISICFDFKSDLCFCAKHYTVSKSLNSQNVNAEEKTE